MIYKNNFFDITTHSSQLNCQVVYVMNFVYFVYLDAFINDELQVVSHHRIEFNLT